MVAPETRRIAMGSAIEMQELSDAELEVAVGGNLKEGMVGLAAVAVILAVGGPAAVAPAATAVWGYIAARKAGLV
jgi:hypothetical protein